MCCHITQRLVTWQGTSHLGSAPLALQQAEQLPLGPRLRGTASACQREELEVPAQAGCRAEGEWAVTRKNSA